MAKSTDFTHIDDHGQPHMVDVGDKKITQRVATATSTVLLPDSVWSAIRGEELMTKKGPVIQTAIIAAHMAVKKTAELIPLCHPLPLDGAKIWVELQAPEIKIYCRVKTTGKTGVEMEALHGATTAALTVYDMCKALSHEIIIKETKLIQKSGGKNDINLV
ncbi:cyclic pyranopterin monophosphate synthase MoaC [Persicobacter psychrovividus]|uniref:cyclic pyranopterin monophosphate synthase n=1 Tax=Persicobacter psychrovividus TaxID=387638 RepID=A0ABM7VHL7_9BACT|nr:cyclic pyranopterin monophosphate synthase accessory protein [Persicobacter psychrovividus]